LAHEYRDIIIFKMWDLSKNDIPILKKEIRRIKELKKYLQ